MKKEAEKVNRFDLKVFFICLVIVFIVAYFGSLFTSDAVNSSWYEKIRPSITPPNELFPIVWTILFFLIALSLYFVWIKSGKLNKKKIMLAFGLNFILNILWSYFYFSLKNLSLAFFDLILLWISIAFMVHMTLKIDKRSAYLLIPYFLWVSFAGILNYLSIIK